MVTLALIRIFKNIVLIFSAKQKQRNKYIFFMALKLLENIRIMINLWVLL